VGSLNGKEGGEKKAAVDVKDGSEALNGHSKTNSTSASADTSVEETY
jgi:hypothetical protein